MQPLGYMPPGFPLDDAADSFVCNVVSPCQGIHSSTLSDQRAYLFDCIRSKARRAYALTKSHKFRMGIAALAFTSTGTALVYHILLVLLRGAGEQVVISDTRWIIATMADEHPWRHRAIVHFVGYAMCQVRAAISTTFAVTSVGQCALPQPTVARLINFRPEARFNPTGSILMGHLLSLLNRLRDVMPRGVISTASVFYA